MKAKYNVDKTVTPDSWVYIKIQKSMPGLKQAAILVCKNLCNCLELHGYTPIPSTIDL